MSGPAQRIAVEANPQTDLDKIRAARDHLFEARCLLRDVYATHNGSHFVYSHRAAEDAVGHAYACEIDVESLLERLSRSCICALGHPEDYEGVLRDCPVHGDPQASLTREGPSASVGG